LTSSRQRRQHNRLAHISLQTARLGQLIDQAWYARDLCLPDGYPTGSSEPVSGGDVSRPVEAAVIALEAAMDSRTTTIVVDGETVTQSLQTGMAVVDQNLKQIEESFRDIEIALSRLIAPLVRAAAMPTRTNMDTCQACDCTVTNTPADRIKSGYCRACYQAWLRADRPDRPGFERERLETATRDDHSRVVAVDRSVDHTPCVEVTSGGVTVTLQGELAGELRRLQQEHPGGVPVNELRRLHIAALEA
jgi:hypothetical protein